MGSEETHNTASNATLPCTFNILRQIQSNKLVSPTLCVTPFPFQTCKLFLFFFSFLIFSSKKWRKWTWRPRQSAWTCGWDHRTCRPTCSSMRCASPDHSLMITIQNHRLPRPPALTQPTSLGHSRRSLMTRTARPGTVLWVRALGLLWLTLPPGFFTSPLTPSPSFSSKRRFSWSRNLEYD